MEMISVLKEKRQMPLIAFSTLIAFFFERTDGFIQVRDFCGKYGKKVKNEKCG
jgi:hypothetical protein